MMELALVLLERVDWIALVILVPIVLERMWMLACVMELASAKKAFQERIVPIRLVQATAMKVELVIQMEHALAWKEKLDQNVNATRVQTVLERMFKNAVAMELVFVRKDLLE